MTPERRAALQAEHRELAADLAAIGIRIEALRLRLQDATGETIPRRVDVSASTLGRFEASLLELLADVRSLRET